MNTFILAINCGSSSIKFALFRADSALMSRQAWWHGEITGIGSEKCVLRRSDAADTRLHPTAGSAYHEALLLIGKLAAERESAGKIRAVVHRIVHGGGKYVSPVLLNTGILRDLRSYVPLAPLHQPAALDAIDILRQSFPELDQVACFDTAFHATLPRVEQLLPLDQEAWQAGLRRYGFHGLSYSYVAMALQERYGQKAMGRTIVAHLGSGASLCAMQGLRSIATTMGFSTLDGLMMNSRCGSVDPGALLYLMQTQGLSPEELSERLYHRSGLLGLSGVSADPRELVGIEHIDERARDALDLYVQRIVREIGALTAVIGGLDLLVFTAGVGENNVQIRDRICGRLNYIGVNLDTSANIANAALISTSGSRVSVAIEATNEEWMCASSAKNLLNGAAPPPLADTKI